MQDADQNISRFSRCEVGENFSGLRLDIFLAQEDPLTGCSRSMYQDLIRNGHVLVNGELRKISFRLNQGDLVTVEPPPLQENLLAAEKVPFDILFEDKHILVLSKPPGVVVHPACGHSSGTLVHGLLYHCDDLAGINGQVRPGIVHRLDKDTSGVMVVAKSDLAHHSLVDQFKQRKVEKIYRAIITGHPASSHGRINLPIGRHPINRKKMAVVENDGREAVTNWKRIENLSDNFAYIELGLETGRTHQIRVHMASLGHPIAGDNVYGGKKKFPPWAKRQCLHSYKLSIAHPESKEPMKFVAPLWEDMKKALDVLQVK
ncbi:MAG: RluA family pseudouridine synthase [Proteobacteria bacterium]|nr:RluA family pseudouridine synthase [Pseudomonadota bacterium]MBU1708728.1 RluA family pseudouridine synthase [Pseudomonadota bacterium]